MRRIIILTCVFSLLCASGRTALAKPIQFSDKAVERAVKKAIQYLWSQQKPDGSWEGYGYNPQTKAYGYPVGPSALAAYSLLAAGVNPQDPRMAKALDWLTTHDTIKTYSMGIRCYVWNLANRSTLGKYRDQLKRDAKRLLESGGKGYYNYICGDKIGGAKGVKQSGSWDNSTSQYGLLGVWAAADDGSVSIPEEYWGTVMKHWIRSQGPNGGWTYRGKPGDTTLTNVVDKNGELVVGKDGKIVQRRQKTSARGTMTAAGVASLFVCYDYSGLADKHPGVVFRPIKKGLDWFDKHFRASLDGYFLYGIERVGLASGYKYFGKKDWYRIGATSIINAQKPNGAIGGGRGDTVNTSFSLLFLVRGQHPVLFNKLQHGGDWNRRSRDAASLTQWIGRSFETTVNWQIINLNTLVNEWHDASIMYVTGTQDPKFTNSQLDKMRNYVLQGGTIFTVVQEGGESFKKAMLKAYERMFGKYKLEKVPDGHEIYSLYFKVEDKPDIQVIDNGVRPFVIHTDTDLAAGLQASKAAGVTGSEFKMGFNIVMYAVSKVNALPNRGAVHWYKADGGKPLRTVKLARVKYDGHWNPEPLAFERFSHMMSKLAKTKVEILDATPAAELLSSGAKIAHLTGTQSVTFSDAQKNALRKFITAGGTLVIDAAGGSKDFTKSIRATIGEIFPESRNRLRRLAVGTSAIYQLPKMEIDSVDFRFKTSISMTDHFPKLRAVLLAGERPGIIFSSLDLTGGLVGSKSYAIDGYDCDSAFKLMRNIVVFAAGQKTPSAVTSVKPTTGPVKPGKKPTPAEPVGDDEW